MSLESHHEVNRSTPERGISHTAFQNERLGEGRNFECNMSAATDKLAKDGVLPKVEIDNGKDLRIKDDSGKDSRVTDGSGSGNNRRQNTFDKFDGDKDGKISGTEWSTKFDNLAGEDQSARLEDFQKEFGDSRRTQRFFDRADQDNDKVVSAGEFLDTFARAESAGNKDEYLGREEFREVTRRKSSIDWDSPGSGGEDGDGDKDQSNAFSNLDANKNNRISATEWINKFDGVAGDAQKVSRKELEAALGKGGDAEHLLKLADNNGDKNIDVIEWMRLFEKLERNGDFTIGKNEFPTKPGFPPIGGEPPVAEPPPKYPVPPIELPPDDTPRSPYQPSPPLNTPEPPVAKPEPRPQPPVERPGDKPSTPIDQPSQPTLPSDNVGDVPRATPQQVEALFSRIERRGASDRYMQEIKQAIAGLPASVVQAAIDGRTRIIANGQGPPGLGGTYNSGTNTVTMYETSPFDTKATLAAEMFHNWDLNPFVGKHVTSQPWFQQAFQRARASGIATGDNTLTNPFEFIHHMARYYSGFTGGVDGQLMNILGADYRARTRQALLS